MAADSSGVPAWGAFRVTSTLSPDGTPGAFHACSVFPGSPREARSPEDC